MSNQSMKYDKHMGCIAIAVDEENNALERTGLNRNNNAGITRGNRRIGQNTKDFNLRFAKYEKWKQEHTERPRGDLELS